MRASASIRRLRVTRQQAAILVQLRAIVAEQPKLEPGFAPTSGTSSTERASQPKWLPHERDGRPIVGFTMEER